MKNTFLTTLVIAAGICGLALFAQSAKSSSLDRQLAEKRKDIDSLESELARDVPISAIPAGDTIAVSNAAIAETRRSSTPEQRIESAQKNIRSLTADLGDINRSPAAFFKILPDMLRIVEALDVAELIRVAESLEGGHSPGQQSPESVSRMILLLLAAEHDPEAVMENPENMRNDELGTGLISALARSDPKAAMNRVDQLDVSESRKRSIRSRIAMQAMLVDVETGIGFLRDLNAEWNGVSYGYQDHPVPSQRLPEVIAAAQNPENADVRGELLAMILNTANTDGGIAATRAQASELELSPEELTPFFIRGYSRQLETEPAAAIEWMDEVLPPEELQNILPSAIARWAHNDYNAAGEWLGKMEPSIVKDESISKYAQAVAQVDPQGASIWASEIDDESVRRSALNSVARQWLAKDRSAAVDWLTSNGYTAETLGVALD